MLGGSFFFFVVFCKIQITVEAQWRAGSWDVVLVLVGNCGSQYSESDGLILLSVECPVICQMQQLLVSMETTHGPFYCF